ncbi:MAG: hypothetical protein HON53_25360 [Planctomycetaceae bacterium]|nr:hypothetical protein [Planctomycetaceae bacterium]MBT6153476.1 hypothetical protein [Planctomycetaceae bacterium]MBT6484692.1 hypothetical protein [Planctomycetaceae bacterium]MBT6496442.1 hypothetical protein [Planctomycetaceae bacterium]
MTGFGSTFAAEVKPLKVYILAGQSNMQGHAKVETFDYVGDDPATTPLLKEMRGTDGKPRVCQKVWISYLTGSREGNGVGTGKLTVGYGARSNPTEDGGKIGPEFTFGITIEKASDGPILIIKTAWGGKSLHTDFRPPSAGPYEFTEAQLENFKKRGKDIESVKADKVKATGHYYRLMTDHAKKVLADIKRVYPDYDAKQGYELAGFVWFQGWNDMVDRGTYPNRDKPGGYAKYSEWMADFIRDVRKDLGASKMPFVIGVMGVGGVREEPNHFRQAMAAPASMPEFKGNVVAVQTAPYWDKPLAAVERKFGKPKKIAYYLRKGGVPARVLADNYPIAYTMRKNYWDTSVEDRKMSKKEQQAYVKEYRAKVITVAEETMWQRGASNAGYHYLGCAKTMALIGNSFAEALLEMERN